MVGRLERTEEELLLAPSPRDHELGGEQLRESALREQSVQIPLLVFTQSARYTEADVLGSKPLEHAAKLRGWLDPLGL
ncbi:MAG: hypothetical protein M3375_01010 [Actinomycetota bacterium]|nr:hypothetical protein [Actinomycetota bacterium]